MQDPDPKCRHFGILLQFMAFYGILTFLPKSLIRNQIRFFRFYPIFRLFPTFRLSDSTALVLTNSVIPKRGVKFLKPMMLLMTVMLNDKHDTFDNL